LGGDGELAELWGFVVSVVISVHSVIVIIAVYIVVVHNIEVTFITIHINIVIILLHGVKQLPMIMLIQPLL